MNESPRQNAPVRRPAVAQNTSGFAARWLRRVLVIGGIVSALLAGVVSAPLAVVLLGTFDVLRRVRFAWTRLYAFVLLYLALETAGVGAAFGVWVANGCSGTRNAARFLRWNFRLQCWWGRSLARGAMAIYGMRLNVEAPFENNGRPILLFVRHASVMDAVLAVLTVSGPHGIVLRYVLKRELQWDPCLDIVGNRLRNYFVDRNAEDNRAEIAEVGALAKGLKLGEGVLIYPEGTRFTQAKRARIATSAREKGDAEWVERVERFTHVLPPRLGGTMALLDANTNADVVFLAHTGFEGAATFRDLARGDLIGKTIRIALWRVPREEIPASKEERTAWLIAQWARVNAYVARHEGH